MRILNDSLIDSPLNITTAWQSEPINLSHIAHYSIQLAFSAASGSVYLEVSNDVPKVDNRSPSSTQITNWTTVAGSTQSLSANGTGLYDVENTGYSWVRVTISGVLSLDSARINGKGV